MPTAVNVICESIVGSLYIVRRVEEKCIIVISLKNVIFLLNS